MSYTFPFSTCEIPDEDSAIAQPVSMGINLFSTVALFVAATYAQKTAFQYHAVIEVLGAVLFISLALLWLDWER